MKFVKIRSFMMGVIATVLISTMVVPAIAATTVQNIKVALGGIKIYVDGYMQIPTDASGNEVEPLIFNGTTYLPVRALTNMLTDKTVNWDQQSMSVYIGKKPNSEGIPLDQVDSNSNVFFLNSNFNSLSCKYTLSPYDGIMFYSIYADGKERLLCVYEGKPEGETIDIDVNIEGVEKLKIVGETSEFLNAAILSDEKVDLNKQSMAVDLGMQPSKGNTPLNELDIYSEQKMDLNFSNPFANTFYVLDKKVTPYNCLKYNYEYQDSYVIYMLNSNYSSIKGKFDIAYTDIGSNNSGELKFYSIDDYGTETLLDSYELKAGDKTADVNINTQGVKILKIWFSIGGNGKFYNVTLTDN